jgi:hypothetical protein
VRVVFLSQGCILLSTAFIVLDASHRPVVNRIPQSLIATTGAWDWEYTTMGGIKLASNHSNAGGDSINMGRVQVLDKVDDAMFADPARPLQ